MIQLTEFEEMPGDAAEDFGGEVDLSFDVDSFDDFSDGETVPQEHDFLRDSAEFFAPGGPLLEAARLEGRPCEFRPQQLAMSRSIAEALSRGRNLAVEAPTGVGKSFAYLAPLIYRSRNGTLPAVISTETITLQEQLIHRDIPLMQQLTGVECRAALAKGRSNYLCLRRLGLLAAEKEGMLLPSPSLEVELKKVLQWTQETETGEREDLSFRIDPQLWQMVCCEPGNCRGGRCPNFRSCFYFKARQLWENADIVVANHALFFTDLAMRSEGAPGALLPNYGTVIIDEAHTLEDNAAEHLGVTVSRAGLFGMLNRLYNPDTARGLLLKNGAEAMALRQCAVSLREDVTLFFRQFEEYLREGSNRPDGSENTTRRVRDTGRFEDILSQPLRVFQRLLLEYIDRQEDENFLSELQSQYDRLKLFLDGIGIFMEMKKADAVYFVENERGNTALRALPLNVAELLNRILFTQDFPVILSSATLTVRNSFDFYCGRIGFDNGDTLLLDSPFARDQATVRVSRRMPEPTAGDYLPALVEELPGFLEESEGKAFLLFTSYSHMRYCADRLQSFCARKGLTMLVQGGDLSRSAMIRTFREDVNSVLFGTDSFWTGVDVPGEALSCVIIPKLPFASPDQPLVAGRCERIESAGGNAFRDYSLPSAVLKFRQGVGRLIRSRSDRGTIVILDRRVLSKSYGKVFLDALPYPLEIVTDSGEK